MARRQGRNGSRGEFGFTIGVRQLGHLHGDHVAHIGFPKDVWHELYNQNQLLPPRLPRQARLCLAPDRERGPLMSATLATAMTSCLNYDRAVERHGLPEDARASPLLLLPAGLPDSDRPPDPRRRPPSAPGWPSRAIPSDSFSTARRSAGASSPPQPRTSGRSTTTAASPRAIFSSFQKPLTMPSTSTDWRTCRSSSASALRCSSEITCVPAGMV